MSDHHPKSQDTPNYKKPEGPEQVPVIIGTNARFFQRLLQHCTSGHETEIACTLRIQFDNLEFEMPRKTTDGKTIDKPSEDEKWMGQGPCKIPSKGEMCMVCDVESETPLEKDMFVLETVTDDVLPVGLFIPPVVFPFSAVNENKCKVLIKNETARDITIPAGTVIAHVFPTNMVTVVADTHKEPKRIDPKFLISQSHLFQQSGKIVIAKSFLKEEMCSPLKNGMWD